MKRTIKLVCLVIFVCTAFVMAAMAYGQISATDDYIVEHLADIRDYAGGYVVKENNGYISIYYRGAGYPTFITDIPLATLNMRDRADVEAGIVVYTRQELMQLIEDLGR